MGYRGSSMLRATRRSGFSLMLAGLAGAGFFWLTDPGRPWSAQSDPYVVDAINQASPGTYVGIAGCAVVVVIGLWLVVRRAD
jgi:hypothetical protein